MASWVPIALAGVIGLVVVLVMVGVARPTTPERVPFIVTFVRFWAIVTAGIAGVAAIAQTIVALMPGAEMMVRTPLSFFWPELFQGIVVTEGPTATIVGGGITEADLLLRDLDLGTRAMLAGGTLLHSVVYVVVALAIAQLCRALARREPFSGLVARSGRIAAITIGVGGVAAQLLLTIGGTRAATEALRITSWRSDDADSLPADDPFATGLPAPGFDISVDFAPIMIALAVWVVAELLAAGARMQAENARLRADTDGLV